MRAYCDCWMCLWDRCRSGISPWVEGGAVCPVFGIQPFEYRLGTKNTELKQRNVRKQKHKSWCIRSRRMHQKRTQPTSDHTQTAISCLVSNIMFILPTSISFGKSNLLAPCLYRISYILPSTFPYLLINRNQPLLRIYFKDTFF